MMTPLVKKALFSGVTGKDTAPELWKAVDDAMMAFAPATGIDWKLVPSLAIDKAVNYARLEGFVVGAVVVGVGYGIKKVSAKNTKRVMKQKS